MFQWLIRFSVKHKAVIGVLTIALIVWGVISLLHLPFDSTPDITSNQVQIITTAPSLGAQEVEQGVTTPVEAALANIPRVKERRSISRSGLSVITLVFDEDADIYWAREQVNQALGEAQRDLDASNADIEMAPLSTGLGEIYHYTVRPAPGYEDKYSLSDIREIQDWIVRRQLAGTPGVAEVSGWGGFVKEYEVRFDPRRLDAAGVTLAQLVGALENNNENTGGSYIEKNSNQYFIRGIGRAGSLEDIGNIVVAGTSGLPLRVKDIAEVGYGHATRYGAVTRNGEGEVVAGIALMLKGENFQEISRNVKQRIDEIRKSLPEGVVVEPFIDRTELVNRVTHTIERNLIEGGLIVIFILILFLGSWRSGLVVASVIPLAMLFAFGMMRLFGVSGNLMSLGAIDFGLIVDGAVIIVECVCLHISQFGRKYGTRELSRKAMDEEVILSASKIRNSAAFGEIIIMIVYLPILTLTGIEGKMFRPMALTIFFAVLGAFLLSLTYVPMASALFLSRRPRVKENYSDRMMSALHKAYQPLLGFCLRHAKALVIVMVALFGGSIWLFTRLGGEFIPTLEEGDFAVEISMAQGTSLSQMVEATTLGEKILREKFPEIKQAVTRIGSAEIPTDPMPVERADMLISLKPKKEWTSARTKDELMEAMAEALEIIPGMEVEMSQPVQMRNNELITGIRQDVAVMVYGPDLDVLSAKAAEIASLIKDVKGVSNPQVERVEGLPQIQVEYSRPRLAAYGITVKDANRTLSAAFAGMKAGTVYEGERAFDVVVRMEKDMRTDIEAVRQLAVALPGGGSVPLSAIASVEYKDAPAQITHEDGERRIYVGFNVRGRDVQTTVNEIRKKIDASLRLPPGYRLQYGGEFKNLQEATGRLAVAVPIALVLILVLLYATLRSVRETLMVFTAIPLALIGGVVALWLRGMPFSISAGVGFIALFGVAVLNGIVLMGQFNTFEKEGITSVRKRIIMGCELRLRPVIMTALVASLGFLPMALSHGDGAEVQRPLATVVIGGLVSATILTLMVIPAVYKLFCKKTPEPATIGTPLESMKRNALLLAGVLLLGAASAASQTPERTPAHIAGRTMTLQECIDSALNRNPEVKAAGLAVEKARVLRGTAFNPPNTSVVLKQETTGGGGPENGVAFSQEFDFPSLYVARRKALTADYNLERARLSLLAGSVEADVTKAYYTLLYKTRLIELNRSLDSMYAEFLRVAQKRYEEGEAGRLEEMNARRMLDRCRFERSMLLTDADVAALELQRLMGSDTPVAADLEATPPTVALASARGNAMTDFDATAGGIVARGEVERAQREIAVARNEFLPSITVGATVQALIKGFNPYGIDRQRFEKGNFMGFEVGLTVPLFFGAPSARLKAAAVERDMALMNMETARSRTNSEVLALEARLTNLDSRIAYYRTTALPNADEICRLAGVSYSLGDINYMEYISNVETAFEVYREYADCINEYNMTATDYNRLLP